MQIETIKRWQWCVLGAGLGCLIAFITLQAGPREPLNPDTSNHAEFERLVIYRQVPLEFRGRAQALNLRNIRIHPAYEGTPEYLTYEYDVYERLASGKFLVQPRSGRLFTAERRHGTAQSRLGPEAHKMAAAQYLTALQDHIKTLDKTKFNLVLPLDWKHSYLEEPRYAYPFYGGIGFVAIGLIWPTILNILNGAGFGRPVKEKLLDLSKYKGETPKPVVKLEPTEDEMARLKRLEEQLEASLREGAKERVVSADVAPVEAPVKKLIGGSAATEVVPVQHDSKDFGADQGDYYPTEIHGKKK